MSLDAPVCERLQPPDARDVADHRPCYGNSRQGWIVATTHPQAERWADQNLQRRGYRTFLPLVAVRRQDRTVRSLWFTVQRPLFGPYLFVYYDSRDPRRPIRETPGVRDVIRCGSEIQWCSDAVVRAVRSAVDGFEAFSAPSTRWKPGTPCTMASGPFSGHPAVITQVGADMATVAVLMFGALREIAVQLDALTPRTD